MKCLKCGTDAIIDGGGYRVTGDGSTDTPTKLFRVLVYRCRNPQCAACGESVGRDEIELPVQGGEET